MSTTVVPQAMDENTCKESRMVVQPVQLTCPFPRERLRGNWGVTEVADAADTVKELGKKGVIDPSRAAIRGGSAGEPYSLLLLVRHV